MGDDAAGRLGSYGYPDIVAAMAAWNALSDPRVTLAALDAASASNPIVKSLAQGRDRHRGGMQPPADVGANIVLGPGCADVAHSPTGSRVLNGLASYYSLPGNRMANGQIFDPGAMNAAMLDVGFGTTVTVALADDPRRSISVVVTDRGPYVSGRIIDLTPAAFTALAGSLATGLVRVVVRIP
ncbi:MAG TPA: septal ring lytic transglycosylase RlpA family protein [Acetobacteraceae bacterium]|nr:septal ring lytic transglycosylase RlpA family protein [Acetobacteraceae bacterium]